MVKRKRRKRPAAPARRVFKVEAAMEQRLELRRVANENGVLVTVVQRDTRRRDRP